LSASTVYNFRVSTNCGSNGASGFSSAQFTTAAPFVCNAPAGLNASAITSSTATLNWTAVSGAVSYAVDYKLSTDTIWTSVATATTSTSAALSGLAASTVYNFRVSTNCGSNGASGFSSAQFTTAAPFVCNAPAGLTASAITSSTATLNWTAVSGAVSYAVDYKLSTSTTWTSAATAATTTSVSISGLSAASLYDYRVSTNCGTNGSSSFTSAQFTTTAASTCSTAFEPNETTSAAAAITSGVVNTAAISSATDIDYFKITTTTTSNITYALVGPTGVDLDLTIYNSAGTQIGSGATTTPNETVSLSSQAAGIYYIKVFGYSGANSQSCYTLTATATTVTACISSYDVSTNNTRAGAVTVPFNTDIKGLVSQAKDSDYYKFAITKAGTITLTLTTLPADYDLKLFNSSGTQVASSANASTTSETINYTAAIGTFYALVYPYSTAFNASTCYTLKVALGTAARGSEDPLQSTVVYPNPAHQILNVKTNGQFETSKIRILNSTGSVAMQLQTASNNTPVNITSLPSGVYMVEVNQNGKVVSKNKFVKQ